MKWHRPVTCAVLLGLAAPAMADECGPIAMSVDGRLDDWNTLRADCGRLTIIDDHGGADAGANGFDMRRAAFVVDDIGRLVVRMETFGPPGQGEPRQGEQNREPFGLDEEFKVRIDIDQDGWPEFTVGVSPEGNLGVQLDRISDQNGYLLGADLPVRVESIIEFAIGDFADLLATFRDTGRDAGRDPGRYDTAGSAEFSVYVFIDSDSDDDGEDRLNDRENNTWHPVCPDDDAPELCNGFDDDCDDIADEARAGGPLTESCYDGPRGTEGVGVCRAGVRACLDAEFGACSDQVLPTEEICDAIDNDCDGMVDEGFPVGEACSDGEGACRVEGELACTDDGGVACTAVALPPGLEECDGIDDDCDGAIDEETVLVSDCTVGDGECTAPGDLRCLGEQGLVCVGEPEPPTAEECNGLDDDCDGEIDEAIEGLGERCELGVGACRAEGVLACGEGGAPVCVAMLGEATDEVCDGIDNDCDGETDEGPGDCSVVTGTAARDCSVIPGVAGPDRRPAWPTLLLLALAGLLVARRKRAIAVAMALVGVGGSAQAQDVQLYQPAPGVKGYFGVDGVRTVGPDVLVPTLHISVGDSPLVNRDRISEELVDEKDYVGLLSTMELGLTYGVRDTLDLHAALPVHAVAGTLIEAEGHDGFHLGDVRFGARYAVLRPDPSQRFGLALAVPVSLATGEADAYVSEQGLVVAPRLNGEFVGDHVRIATNVGARFRSEDLQLGTLELSHELTYGLGFGVHIMDRLEALIETQGRSPLTDVDPLSAGSPLEGRVGLRWTDEIGYVVSGGLGTGLTIDYGASRLRGFVGVAFVGDPCGYDSDGDGAGDMCDRCPAVVDADQIDSDGDGVGDACDLCPLVADAEQKDADADGVGDACDNCVAVANAEQADLDEDDRGDACDCTIEVGRVELEFDKADIKGLESFAVLDRMADILARYPEIRRLEVQGHTDTMGKRDCEDGPLPRPGRGRLGAQRRPQPPARCRSARPPGAAGPRGAQPDAGRPRGPGRGPGPDGA